MIDKWIDIKETNFICGNNQFKIKGFGLGTFLNIEHFMLKIPGIEQNIRKTFKEIYGSEIAEKFWENFEKCFFNENDAIFLKQLGVNTIRLPFNYHHLYDDENDIFLEKGFKSIDRVIDICEENEIYVILDLHTAPGGQNPDWHSDNLTGESLFWHYGIFQKKIIELWELIAKKYKDKAVILGYDILNEPVIEHRKISGKIVNDFYKKVISAIRKYDKNHIIFLEGDFYANDTTKFDPPEDHKIAYSIHFYPFFYVEKNLGRYKKMTKNERIDFLKTSLKNTSLDDIRNRLNRPVWCGETGVPYRTNYIKLLEILLDETLEVFERENISWSIWTYKDANSMGIAFPQSDSLWTKLTQKLTRKWNFLKEFADSENKAKKYIRKICKEIHPDIELIRKVKFKLLSIKDLILIEKLKYELNQISPFEIVKYADSFKIENCNIWHNLLKIIKKWL
ncbi:MAG: glycoside hydrolase family 5 protein [Brevinematales bacterium]|nr:glycoside hydrolase family 5 protein [Brevinematales bacterium]